MKSAKSKKLADKSTEQQAYELLGAPDFFYRVLKAIRRGGLVGEQLNALLVYVVGISARRDRPLSVIVKAKSSSGKNFLVQSVLRIFPKDAVREITSSSATAWNYSENDFVNQIVFLQERNDAAGGVYQMRMLISEGQLRRIVTVFENGKRVTKTYVASGPIACISTTTNNRIEIDDENRAVSIWMDESEEQTAAIMKAYLLPTTPLSEDELEVWREVHRMVAQCAAVPITIPDWFTTMVVEANASDVKSRRYFPAFVEACKTIALIRSFERYSIDSLPKTIEISFADFAVAELIFERAFVGSLTPKKDAGFNIRQAVADACVENEGEVNAQDVAEYSSIPLDSAYRLLKAGVREGELVQSNTPARNNEKFYLPGGIARFIPEPISVLEKIKGMGDVKFCHPVSGQEVVLSKAEEDEEEE